MTKKMPRGMTSSAVKNFRMTISRLKEAASRATPGTTAALPGRIQDNA
jgi:hypothetical protein